MCVLCVCKAGHDLPTKKELMAMHRANPHGCGFASKSLSYKGMNFETFYNRLQYVPKDENVIIHFRFATHGSIGVKNCHPFKKGTLWFAHNGILDIEPREDMTDSETAFRDILYPVARTYGIHSDELKYTVQEIIGYSKFAFLDTRTGDVSTFGDFVEHNGYYCSNMNWVSRIHEPRYSRSWYWCA